MPTFYLVSGDFEDEYVQIINMCLKTLETKKKEGTIHWTIGRSVYHLYICIAKNTPVIAKHKKTEASIYLFCKSSIFNKWQINL
jgi:hypothetical protein